MKATSRFVPLLLALVLFTPALAAAPGGAGLLGTIWNVDTWLQELETYAGIYEAGFETVAYALASLGFIASLIGVLSRGSLGGMNDLFLRLFMTAGLLALSPSLTSLSIDTWKALRDWSGEEMLQSYQEGAVELQQLSDDATVLAVGVGGGVMSAALRFSSASAAQAAAQGTAQGALRFLNLAIIPIATIALISHFILLGSGIAILIATAFLPVSAAMLAFSPMQGGEWMGKIVGTVVSALVVTAFMPLIFKAGFNLMVVQPITAVNEEFAEFKDFFEDPAVAAPPARLAEIQREREALYAQMEENLQVDNLFGRAWGGLKNMGLLAGELTALGNEELALQASWVLGLFREQTNAIDAIGNEIRRWFVRLVILCVGAFMASGLVWWGARAGAGMVGGVIGGKVGALAAGGLAGLFAGGGRRGGETSGTRSDRSSYRTVEATPRIITSDGGPSGGGGRSYSPSEGASTTSAPASGTATATLQNQRGGHTGTQTSEAGESSSTHAPSYGSVSRT